MGKKPTYEELEKQVMELREESTKRIQAEEALDAQNRLLTALLDNLQAGVFMVEAPTGKPLLANKRAIELLGRGIMNNTDKNTLAKVYQAYQLETDKPYPQEKMPIVKGMYGESIFVDDMVVVRPDGTKVLLEVFGSPVKDKKNHITASLASFTDITERKESEKKLLASHAMFLTVLNSIPATIYVADLETYEILFMNKHIIETFGKDFTGKVCWDVFCGEPGPCKHCTNPKLLDSDGHPGGVIVWHGKNKITGKWYINYDRAITWVDGRIVRIQIATDISELRRLESQLQQSQKMEAIGNLAGGIAHDFNNILSAVVGYSELLMVDAEKGSTAERNLIEIHRAGLRARDLVMQILTFARQADQDLKPVKVSAIINEAMKLLRPTIPVSIRIVTDIKSDSLVMADPTKIHQIIMNLCTNASHAMEEDGGIMEVKLTDIEWTETDQEITVGMESGAYLKITVSDTGKGISEENLPLIFEPYFTTKRKGEGTGLGLSVVHGIVKGYKGDILVKSKLGSGTMFTIYLPKIISDKEKKPLVTETLQMGNERILYVDDELPICTMGSQMLERLGYKVTARTSSVEALEIFRSKSNDFDIVITDMTMPNMNGDKLAFEIMNIRPDIPVVLCTGYSSIISDEKAEKIGIKAFVMKPLTITGLSNTVREVLDQIKQSESTESTESSEKSE